MDWGSYIISLAKTTSKKIGALIHSMKFLSPEVTCCLYKSTIHACIEYCCHVWAGPSSCCLELLDKLQKPICRTVGPSLAASLELLAHCRDVVSLSLFIGINTLTANYEYSCSNSKNLLSPIQMQLSKKPKIFCYIFLAFLESTLNFQCFEKKMSLIGQIFLELLPPKDVLT